MRRCLLLLGFMALLGLVLILREVIVAFEGNMLTPGLALAAWFLAAAAGFLAAGARKGEPATPGGVVVALAAYGAMIPVALLTARLACLFLRSENEALLRAVAPVCVAVALPHGCFTGILASLLLRLDAAPPARHGAPPRRALGWTGLGVLAAAAVVSLPENLLATPLQVALAAAAICALTAFVLWRNSGKHALPWGWALLRWSPAPR